VTGSSQRRRRDPQPASRGGELALIVLAAVLLLLALAALTGLGAAAALFGGGWVWPESQDSTGEVLGGLLSGQPGRGLPARLQDRVPGPGAVYSTVAVATLLTAALTSAGGVLFWRYHRPTDARRGMATRAEAAQVLGRGRLRAARTILRPDLYSSTRGRPR
jgi:hypothetical protein